MDLPDIKRDKQVSLDNDPHFYIEDSWETPPTGYTSHSPEYTEIDVQSMTDGSLVISAGMSDYYDRDNYKITESFDIALSDEDVTDLIAVLQAHLDRKKQNV